jgi:hypothetical protein
MMALRYSALVDLYIAVTQQVRHFYLKLQIQQECSNTTRGKRFLPRTRGHFGIRIDLISQAIESKAYLRG